MLQISGVEKNCGSGNAGLNNRSMADSEINSFYRPITIVGQYIGATLIYDLWGL